MTSSLKTKSQSRGRRRRGSRRRRRRAVACVTWLRSGHCTRRSSAHTWTRKLTTRPRWRGSLRSASRGFAPLRAARARLRLLCAALPAARGAHACVGFAGRLSCSSGRRALARRRDLGGRRRLRGRGGASRLGARADLHRPARSSSSVRPRRPAPPRSRRGPRRCCSRRLLRSCGLPAARSAALRSCSSRFALRCFAFWRVRAIRARLARFLVRSVVTAPAAELAHLDPVRIVAPVLVRLVVAALALLASERYRDSNVSASHLSTGR